jgi:carbonic anhydrase/acetyltransferase-like protein (isoleucine patch superfamily)
LEGGYLYMGVPAQRSRALTDRELEYLEYTAANYVRLAARHKASCG